jgi:hypothetical protein
MGGKPDFTYLLFGGLLVILGFLFIVVHPNPEGPSSGRFRLLRRKRVIGLHRALALPAIQAKREQREQRERRINSVRVWEKPKTIVQYRTYGLI